MSGSASPGIFLLCPCWVWDVSTGADDTRFRRESHGLLVGSHTILFATPIGLVRHASLPRHLRMLRPSRLARRSVLSPHFSHHSATPCVERLLPPSFSGGEGAEGG